MNVIEDTQKHIELVRSALLWCASELEVRCDLHDKSKLFSPEREMFEIYRPKLDALNIDSPEYKQALAEMGGALQHHYQANRHHPEHFENGIDGMNLIDLVEMVCDWKAAAMRKNERVNMDWARKRFNISEQLAHIIENTVAELASHDNP